MPQSFLVKLRTTGNRIPFVSVLCDEASRLFPEYLDNERPVYALKHQGDSGGRIPLDQVETIAARYLADLRASVPSDPVVLCGYSFGGIVAYEMAQQLTASGARPPLLIIIDSYVPSLHDEAMQHGRHFLGMLKDQLVGQIVENQLRRGKPLNGKLNHYHIIHTYSNAISAYKPKPYEGLLALIRASDDWGPVDLGWYSLVRGRFLLKQIQCNHAEMVKSHGRELAGVVRELINETCS
ncbi:MAG TPA: thioesterase domain-containing protein [Flavobacteriales bacterium]|nr:thioesterase domain-containing protein [Flavobacteriales bacterium]